MKNLFYPQYKVEVTFAKDIARECLMLVEPGDRAPEGGSKLGLAASVRCLLKSLPGFQHLHE